MSFILGIVVCAGLIILACKTGIDINALSDRLLKRKP